MSRIWAALPLIDDPFDPAYAPIPTRACWWRHRMPPNEDGHEIIVRTDTTTDYQAARLGCWEWFDGLDEQLILGVDVFRVHVCYDGARSHIDVLALDVPTRSLGWSNLTAPEEPWQHDCVFPISASAFTGSPYTVAPKIAGRVMPDAGATIIHR